MKCGVNGTYTGPTAERLNGVYKALHSTPSGLKFMSLFPPAAPVAIDIKALQAFRHHHKIAKHYNPVRDWIWVETMEPWEPVPYGTEQNFDLPVFCFYRYSMHYPNSFSPGLNILDKSFPSKNQSRRDLMFVEPKKIKKQRCFRPHASPPPPLFQVSAPVVFGQGWQI